MEDPERADQPEQLHLLSGYPGRIGADCTLGKYCGFDGIFSLWGSWPSYHGTVVEDHITFDKNNHFVSNIYNGPSQFMVQEQGCAVSWTTWQASPYHQNAGRPELQWCCVIRRGQ
jgi:hypothetical protein